MIDQGQDQDPSQIKDLSQNQNDHLINDLIQGIIFLKIDQNLLKVDRNYLMKDLNLFAKMTKIKIETGVVNLENNPNFLNLNLKDLEKNLVKNKDLNQKKV